MHRRREKKKGRDGGTGGTEGSMRRNRGAGVPRGLQCTVPATANRIGAQGGAGALHIVVYCARGRESEQRGAKGHKERTGQETREERERGSG